MGSGKHPGAICTPGLILAIAALAALLAAPGATATEVRYHGVQIDDQNRVILEECNGTVRVGLLIRARPFGGEPKQELAGTVEGETGRYTDSEQLLEVSSEVLKPSAPNYLQNPGEAYRIRVRGLSLFPDYERMIDVDAANAREVVVAEFERFWSRCSNTHREALYRAAPLAVEVLKEADRLPGEIMKSVLRSKSGRFRITEQGLQRRGIRPGQVFAPEWESGRIEAGATMRAQDQRRLPKGATGLMEVRGIGMVAVPVGPRTPAASAAMESLEAAQAAAAARTGSMGRSVTWAPTGASIGQYITLPETTQEVGEYVPER
ncbi:MAG: hypothetical protein GY851_22550 [bacterium]|nr:hypothetical protein [bacterium]